MPYLPAQPAIERPHALKAPEGTRLAESAGMDTPFRLSRRRRRLAVARDAESGQALLEVAITLPILLLVAVSIFEFGRAYQTSQVLTNAARDGARVAVLPNAPTTDLPTRVNSDVRDAQHH